MDTTEMERAVRELARSCGEAVTYDDIRGSSMRFLIAEGDAIRVRTAVPGAIAAGDVVLFVSPREGLRYPHRVIRRVRTASGFRYLVKGDTQPVRDAEWIAESDIAGKIVAVRKGGREIPLERGAGRWLNLICGVPAILAAQAARIVAMMRAFPASVRRRGA